MKKIFHFFSKDWYFAFLFSTILITAAFIPFFHETFQTPKDNIFLGTHNNALDYPMFISEIIQAQRGRWTFLAKFTSEAQPGTLVHPIYIPLGKLGALLNLPPPIVYHLARIIFGFTLALSTFYFIMQVFPSNTKVGIISKRKLAFLLALFSAGFSQFDFSKWPPLPVDTYLGWWTGGDVLRRAVFQPHAMLKNTLLLLILVWMAKFLTGNSRKYLYFSLPAGLFLGLLDPMNTMTILLLLGFYGLYRTVKSGIKGLATKNIRYEIKEFLIYIFPLIIYFIFAGSALLYMNWVFSATPWRAVRDWEAHQFYTVPFWDYANHIGLTFYLGALGLLLLILKKRNIFTYYVIFLIVGPIFLITSGFTQKFGLSTLRFFQTPVYIFLAIASTEFISLIFFALRKIINTLFSARLCNLIFALCTLLLFIPSIPTYYLSYQNQYLEFKPWYWNIYPDKDFAAAADWLKLNTPLDSVVLSNSTAGNIIPAMSGNTVYVGHMVSTIDYGIKNDLVTKFLSGQMLPKDAKTILDNGRVDYVLLMWGEQYRVHYPFLTKVYENPTTMIYRYNKTQ